MATIIIRNLDDEVAERLRLQARLRGVSVEQEARRVLNVARLQAKVAGCRVRCRLILTRSPGSAIVEEAEERRSDLIYISTEHAPSGEGPIGPTIRYVLAHRSCRVVVEHDPTTAGIGQNGDGVVPAGVFVGGA